MGKGLNGKELGKGISQRRDGLYMGRIKMGDESKTIYNRNLTQLRRDLTDIRSKMQHGQYKEDNKMPFGDWFEKWLLEYAGQRKKGTIIAYKRVWATHIKNTKLEKIPLCDLKNTVIQRFLNDMVGHYSQSVIHSVFTLIRLLVNQAYKNEMISRPETDFCIEPKSSKEVKKREALTPEQQEIFVNSLNGSYLRTFFLSALYSGMRVGELLGLQWQDVDFDGGIIHVERTLHQDEGGGYFLNAPKSKAGKRIIPIVPKLEAVLKEQYSYYNCFRGNIRSMGKDENFVFFAEDFRPYTHGRVQYGMEGIVKKIKKNNPDFPNLVSHELRHTFCSNMARAGMNPRTLQAIMGHSRLDVTMQVYTHVQVEQIKTEALKAAASM